MSRALSRGATLFDTLLLVAGVALVLSVLRLEVAVRHVLGAESAALADLRDLATRVDAYRASAARDLDHDGVGETGPLGDMLGERARAFRRADAANAWRRGGYWFTALVPGRDRTPAPPSDDPALADLAEAAWLLVAWPVEPGTTGMRAYLRTQHDGLLRHTVDGYPYGGPTRPPFPRVPLARVVAGRLAPASLRDEDAWVSPREDQRGR